MSILVALGAIFMLIEVPYPLVPFLKFDLGEIVVLTTAQLFGFIPAVIVSIFKVLVHMLIFGITSPYAIGQITSIIASITIAALYLLAKKTFSTQTLKDIMLRCLVTIIVFSIILTICNYFFITPIYLGALWYTDIKDTLTLASFIPWLDWDLGYAGIISVIYLPFNALKGVLVLVVYELIWPRIKRVK